MIIQFLFRQTFTGGPPATARRDPNPAKKHPQN
jgi:hypothetical protein